MGLRNCRENENVPIIAMMPRDDRTEAVRSTTARMCAWLWVSGCVMAKLASCCGTQTTTDKNNLQDQATQEEVPDRARRYIHFSMRSPILKVPWRRAKAFKSDRT